ncbi:tyrosine-type recombinase/integrase [Niveibacterium terrae]|uniref:tyrosine-type recombinase/integrase n=1 Tax=Niveibacterium terrae TaxID=3373598 RepID=UPI003A90A551
MGRKPTVNFNLPPGMRVKRRGEHSYYSLDAGTGPDGARRSQSLGKDYVEALRRYADLVKTVSAPAVTVPELLTKWQLATLNARPAKTQRGILSAIPPLLRFFGDPPAPLHGVRPMHVAQYLAWRPADSAEQAKKRGRKQLGTGAASANREIAWLSAAWNWARAQGVTDLQNPCEGIKKNRESGRDLYIEDDELDRILKNADEPLRDAIELAYLLGQRPGDLRKILETDIGKDGIRISQSKTKAKLVIELSEELSALVSRIKTRKAKTPGVRSLYLLCDESGQGLTANQLRCRFDRAREGAAREAEEGGLSEVAEKLRRIQFRDLRAKAGTDKRESAKDVRAAQLLLGHTTSGTTERYTRRRKGERTTPTR